MSKFREQGRKAEVVFGRRRPGALWFGPETTNEKVGFRRIEKRFPNRRSLGWFEKPESKRIHNCG
jgi:hypothetical protein